MTHLPKLSDEQFDVLVMAEDNRGRKLTTLDFAECLFGVDRMARASGDESRRLRKIASGYANQLCRLHFFELCRGGFYRITDAGRAYLSTPVPAGVEV